MESVQLAKAIEAFHKAQQTSTSLKLGGVGADEKKDLFKMACIYWWFSSFILHFDAAIPAQIAGCEEIVMFFAPNKATFQM